MKPLIALLLLTSFPALADDEYRPGDLTQRPSGSAVRVLPEQFLRGYDPVTVYFPEDVASTRGPADDGAKWLKLAPDWPGAWVWVDRRTLQFRPAEPWPALSRFAFEARGTRAVLTTMMSAPSAMAPGPGSEDLRPFRSVTLTFPQALPREALRKMLSLELRDLPGLADSPRRRVTDFTLAELPRATQRDAATYAITLESDVPEGKQLVVGLSLALGNEGTSLWQGRLSTRVPFHLASVQCGGATFALAGGGSTQKDMALACGNRGEAPQLLFSAPVADLTLTQLKKLVRLEPSVPNLRFQLYGSRVQLQGKFVPDVLYKMTLGPAPIVDDSGRPLRDPTAGQLEAKAEPVVYFHLGWKTAFVRWNQSNALLEAKGPRMLPLTGYGDARADVRIYRVDPLYAGLWPFPSSPVVVDEQAAPPFPGEEPPPPRHPGAEVGTTDVATLVKNLRLLGSPLVSRVVDLPLADKSGTTQFGLDLKPLLDPVVGAQRPGTYLVGLRRLTGGPQRSYVRVQVTDLSLSTVEERDRAYLFVRTLGTAEPVSGATIVLEGTRKTPAYVPRDWNPYVRTELVTDRNGRALLESLPDWASFTRLSVRKGDDALVISPSDPLPRFADNHWSGSGSWLSWLTYPVPSPVNDRQLGFLFTERPIYRPGEPVLLKGFVRRKERGELKLPSSPENLRLEVRGPDGQSWPVPVKLTGLAGVAGTFKEPNAPTGRLTAVLYDKDPNNVVATRAFQIEAYRIPTFEVQLAGAQRVPLDAPFKMKAVARYYAGGNVTGQPISWTVTQQPYHYVPRGKEKFLFASSTQFARPGAQRPSQPIRKDATLDGSGAASLEVNPALDMDGSARIYRFEATVTGVDNQPVSATQEVKALPPFVLGMKLVRYAEKAVDLRPELVAIGIDDKPIKGQEISVRLYRRVWRSNLRETHFATGEAKYLTEQEDQKLLEKTVVSAEAPVVPVLPVREAGVYVVELVAKDKLGRVQTLSADLFVGGPQPLAWQRSRDGVFELSPDKKSYAPGETAHLVVQSPFQSAQALVVTEEPGGNTYEWHEVGSGKAVLSVPIGAQHVPNLPVHVMLMRGRLGEGKSDDTRYKPASVGASVDLRVEPVKNRLTVEVAHPESALPGKTVELAIRLTDDQKRPVGGEVTLWLVDEAVLSLAKEGPLDPLTAMVVENQRTTAIRDSRNLVVGRLAELEEDPGGDGSEGERSETGKRVVRKNFKTVPFYEATVEVPEGGKVVKVTLSDDLTNFKVRAVAVSGAARFGHAQSTLRVRLPVLVQPQLPRFVRQGDQFLAGGLARLVEGAEGKGSLEVRVTGPVDGKPERKEVTLQAAAPQSLRVPVTVRTVNSGVSTSLSVRMDVTRHSDKAGDAFSIDLPVLPDRNVETFAYFDSLPDGRAKLKAFPEPVRPGTGSQRLLFTNQPGVLELASSLDYLSGYAHGCLEQRMSQLYPDVALGGLLRRLELATRFTPQMASSTRRLLEDMPLHQDGSGLFGYWPGARGEVTLTAHALEFMVAAQKAGFPVDAKVRARALDALKRSLRSDYPGLISDYRLNQHSSALRALSAAGELDEHYAIDLYQHREKMDATSLADLTSAMSVQPALFKPNLGVLRGELWDTVVTRLYKGQPVFSRIQRDRSQWSYGYLGSSTSTVSAVFEALLRVDPSDTRHDLMRDALLASGSASAGFGSTHDNRRALIALGTYLERARTDTKPATVTLPGGPPLSLLPDKKVAQRTLASDQPAEVTVAGGPLGMRGAYQYVPAAPGDQVQSLKSGLIVSRSATVLRADGSAPAHLDDRAGQALPVAVGDLLELHARLVTEQERHHVALVVPFAAGLEPLNPALETSGADARASQADSLAPTYVQRLDHEVRYYFTHLPAGSHTFHFRVRAASEGSYVHPAPWAELMYRQEVRGRGEGLRVQVAPPRGK